MSISNQDLLREKQFLNKVYGTYSVHESYQTKVMRELIFKTFEPFIHKGSGLELGCSDGYMTKMLSGSLEELIVVDGSKCFVEEAKKRSLSNVEIIYSLFEEYQPSKKFDYIFASYILEHVIDPVKILTKYKEFLKPNGLLMIVVPNSRSLSRQLALHMGCISKLNDLTENDLNHGHRRVYDLFSLNKDISISGLKSISEGGIMLKILADFQMDVLLKDQFLNDEHIKGLVSLGKEHPDLCGSIFTICKNI